MLGNCPSFLTKQPALIEICTRNGFSGLLRGGDPKLNPTAPIAPAFG